MNRNSRRNFIRGMALAGVATACLPLSDTWAMGRPRTRKPKPGKGKVILFQGDSITDGNRGRSTDPNHIMGHGYAFSIASRWGAEYPEKGLTFINKGISGNKIVDLAARWQKDTLDLKPDVLSILVGVNDSSSVVFKREPIITVEKYEEGYRSLIEQTKAQFPEIVLVLCEPFILPVGKVKENWEAYQADMVQRQDVVRKLAQQYVAIFIGLQKVFDKACQEAPADYWIWDGVHPTVAGHELITQEWIRLVGKRI
ncbi:MAG TPA: SGNH/GDSL hydrolase family protein [Prolixibacteraceae bacterium]|jgi:lysophospholipase L1-like esterase